MDNVDKYIEENLEPNQELMSDIRKLMEKIKVHIFDLGGKKGKLIHKKPTNEEIDELIFERLFTVLREKNRKKKPGRKKKT